jgi:hypothetical protein
LRDDKIREVERRSERCEIRDPKIEDSDVEKAKMNDAKKTDAMRLIFILSTKTLLKHVKTEESTPQSATV